MQYLPARPDLDQLRHQAKDLLRLAKAGDPDALAQIRSVSHRLVLASAQLAIAREYGFGSWPQLKSEVDRREILNSRDVARLSSLLAEQPELARVKLRNWCDHKQAGTVAYMAMMRFDHNRLGLPRELPGTGAVAKVLIDAGAPVDGYPDDKETPLITAASYGDAEVARVLIEAGADLDATAAPDAGGVPGGTALLHAAVFGMTEVVDVLVEAGARIDSLELAAAAGAVNAWPLERSTLQSRIRALVFAADHQRLQVIDRLIAAGTPIDAVDAEWDRQALRTAANHGRPASVRRLLDHGADPNLRDRDGLTALDLCQPEHRYLDNPGHDEVDAILRPITTRA
jgi:ankyrin repeat protein